MFSQVKSSCENKTQTIFNYNKKENMKKMKFTLKRPAVAAAAIALVIALSATVYGLVTLLTPSEVAREFGNDRLASAFEMNGIEINESVVSDGKIVTLHGLTIGSNLDSYLIEGLNVDVDKTYFVFSIAKEDGSPFVLDTNKYFFSSAIFFEGYRPWILNSWTMGYGGTFDVIDGVWYMLMQITADIEMFADRAVYFAIWDSNSGISKSAESLKLKDDGTIEFVEGLSGMHAMFTLPLESDKADIDRVIDILVNRGGMFESMEFVQLYPEHLVQRLQERGLLEGLE
jgi:hypothetical protein